MGRLVRVLMVGAVAAFVAGDLYLAASWISHWQLHRRRGFTSRFYTDAAGNERGYALFVPHQLPTDKRPALLMFLNGAGENGRDGVHQISNNFGEPIWELLRRFPMICLAPQCRESWGVGSPDTLTAMAILDEVIAEYDVDPDRVYLTGVSAGGRATWETSAAYPEKFAAIVPVSGKSYLSADEIRASFAANNIAIWNFYNDGDATTLVSNNRAFREQLLSVGLSPIFTEYHQGGHDAWSASYRTAAMYEWLWNQSRKKNLSLVHWTPFRGLPVDPDLSPWRVIGVGEWAVSEGVLSASPGVTESSLFYSAALGDFEFHFDYRALGDAPCVVILKSGDLSEKIVRVVVDWPDRGTGGVFHEDPNKPLGRLDPLAQQELIHGRWNDIRISRIGNTMQVRANGALLYDQESDHFGGPRHIGIVQPADDSCTREWRYIRVREAESFSSTLGANQP